MLLKKSIKILDQKPLSYHQCNILGKYNCINFKNSCFIYKILHGLVLLHFLLNQGLTEVVVPELHSEVI